MKPNAHDEKRPNQPHAYGQHTSATPQPAMYTRDDGCDTHTQPPHTTSTAQGNQDVMHMGVHDVGSGSTPEQNDSWNTPRQRCNAMQWNAACACA